MGDPAKAIGLVDAHMHLWDLSRQYYSWLQDDPLPNNPAGDIAPIAHRSYLLNDYFSDCRGWDVRKIVHVECGLPKSNQLAETDWLQDMARERGHPDAIVAGALLNDPEVEETLEAHAARPNVRGVRQIVNFHSDPAKTYTSADLLEEPAWRAGYALLAKYGLSFDLQAYPAQFADAAGLAAKHAQTQIILNHAGMPTDRDAAGVALWEQGMTALAAQPNVAVKVSGLGMMIRDWTVESIRPFILRIIDLFGADRCMFASNFPVDRIHGSFDQHFSAFSKITQNFTDSDKRKLFAATAERIYRI